MFQFPAFASYPYVFESKIPYHNAWKPKPTLQSVWIFQAFKVGFPIRKSADQSSFAAPHGLSQRITSFIASQRQGIHRMLLRHLIVLMIDVREINSLRHMIRKTIMLAECTRFNESRWCRTFRMLQDEQLSNTFPLHNDKQQRNHRFR